MKIRMLVFFVVLLYNAFSGFVVTDFLPGLERIVSIGRVASDALMIALAITCMPRQRSFAIVPLTVLFFVLSTLTFIYNLSTTTIVYHLNGIRDPLFFLASLIVVWDLMTSARAEAFVRLFTVFVIVFALAQLPTAFAQFLRNGAGDSVGGTYGWGGSGYLSQTLFLMVFYLMVKFASDEDGENFIVRKVVPFIFLLVPCAINETKVSFVLLAVLIFLLVVSRNKMLRSIPLLALGVGMLYFLDYIYSQTAGDTKNIFNDRFIEKYLYSGPTNPYGGDLPRFARIPIMLKLFGSDILAHLLGLGYGLFSGHVVLGTSRISRALDFFRGSRMLLFTLWVQGGILTVMLYAVASFRFLRSKLQITSTETRFRWFLGFSILLAWAYNDALLSSRAFAMLVSFITVYVTVGGAALTAADRGNEPDEDEGDLPVESALRA